MRENNQAAGKTWVYAYDNAGNILSKSRYAYSEDTVGTPQHTATYSYGDSSWGDLLTAYDGKAITYDGIGNPLSDGSRTYTWKHGRQLATLNDGSVTWNYLYNVNGLRSWRYNNSKTYKYVYNGEKLVYMLVGSDRIYITYDAAGTPTGIRWNDSDYYYATNLQGDVIAILDYTGAVMVEYTYDAWGNILTATGSMADTLGKYNPLRYRGYVYDQEYGLYYLQSRYYNPTTGRFLNADAFAATGQGLLGNNIFSYCLNNPANCVDDSGARCVSILSRLDGGSKLTIYNSADEAAQAFAKETYNSSLYIRHEYGAEIYTRTFNGKTVYDYTTPRCGAPHSVLVGYPTPTGTELVAFVHTHPNSNTFSPGDKYIAHKFGIDAYVVGPNLTLQRYDLNSQSSVVIGTISPKPLTALQCNTLIQEHRVSWDYHKLVGCEFRCGTIDWPTTKGWFG